jgi:hypothetical protein
LNQPSLESVVEARTQQELEDNCLRLKTSVAAVKWLTDQACAFRGNDETAQSRNRGNFLEFVRLLVDFNPEIARVVLENALYNAKYTSPKIQKEILSIFACEVRKYIREEIGDSKFSIMVDESCDASK